MAIHILHKLVLSARLFMKMASWGFVFWCLILPESLLFALRRWCVGLRAVPEPTLWWGALRLRRRLLALRLVLPWKFRQISSIVVLLLGKLRTIWYSFSFPGAASDGPCFSGAGDVSTEVEVRHKRRRIQAVITRGFVPLSGQEPGPVEIGSHERGREMLEHSFDDGSGEFKWGDFSFGSLWFPPFIELFRPSCRWSCNYSS